MNYGYYHNNRRYSPASFVQESYFDNNNSSSKSFSGVGVDAAVVRPKSGTRNNYNAKYDESKGKPSRNEFDESKGKPFRNKTTTPRSLPRGGLQKTTSNIGRGSSRIGYNSSSRYAAGGYNNGSNFKPSPNKSNWNYDEKRPSNQARFTARAPKYSNLNPEHLPTGLHTVKVSGLPKRLPENGLYNFFRCLGEVMNIYVPPSTNVEFNTEGNETYTAMVTVRRYFEAMEIQRMNGRSVFGSRICVDFGYGNARSQQEYSWKNARLKRNNSFAKLPNEVLLKIFAHLDFVSRIRVESVCKNWRDFVTKNLNKLPVADGSPNNVKLTIAKNICHDHKETAIKFNKNEQRMSVHLVTNGKKSFCVEIYNSLKKFLPKMAKSVVDVYIDQVDIDKVIIMLLDNYCARDYHLSLHDVIAHDLPLHFYQSFVDHFSNRLTITPEYSWPVHFIL